jgi:UDP-N-acetylmuramate--alanine ligase
MTAAARPDFPALAAGGPVHFIGVGGAGMLALAALVARSGAMVTGSDRSPTLAQRVLGPLGVRVTDDDDPTHVTGAAVVVISAAVAEGHPELAAARLAGIPVLKRAVALGEWVNRGRVVAVAGTHGKTTTTAMITEVLAAAGLDPVGLVGGTVAAWEGNLRPGRSDLYVVEADEYDRSFHALRPSVAVVTSLEADHLDIYGSLEAVRTSFEVFLSGVRQGGTIAVCADDPGASALLAGLPAPGTTYGLSAGSQVRGTEATSGARTVRARVLEQGRDRGWIEVAAPGLHNLRNALAACTVARSLGVEWDAIRAGLARFRGVHRRFEWLGEIGGISVVDDYAHHPTELREALRAARGAVAPGGRLVAVFQPHLFSRTLDFHREFGAALAAADHAWVTDIYPAREAPLPGVTGRMVADAVGAAGGTATYHPPLGGLAEAVVGTLRSGDLCITLGAGSVEQVGPEIVARLREAAHV